MCAACGCWLHHSLGCDCAADAVLSITSTQYSVQWYSFRRPRKDDRLNQPHLVLIQYLTGAQTQGPKILSQPPSPLSQHQAFASLMIYVCLRVTTNYNMTAPHIQTTTYLAHDTEVGFQSQNKKYFFNVFLKFFFLPASAGNLYILKQFSH